jgi:hypothetical protein
MSFLKKPIYSLKPFIMRKYLFGIIALVLASGLVAFTRPSKSTKAGTTLYYFAISVEPTTETITEDRSNWEYLGTSDPEMCNGGNTKACLIGVDESSTTLVNGVRALSSDVQLEAVEGDGNGVIVWWIVVVGVLVLLATCSTPAG